MTQEPIKIRIYVHITNKIHWSSFSQNFNDAFLHRKYQSRFNPDPQNFSQIHAMYEVQIMQALIFLKQVSYIISSICRFNFYVYFRCKSARGFINRFTWLSKAVTNVLCWCITMQPDFSMWSWDKLWTLI